MTKNVLRRYPAMLFWLVAGTGIAAIVTFTGAVLMVAPPERTAHIQDVPPVESKTVVQAVQQQTVAEPVPSADHHVTPSAVAESPKSLAAHGVIANVPNPHMNVDQKLQAEALPTAPLAQHTDAARTPPMVPVSLASQRSPIQAEVRQPLPATPSLPMRPAQTPTPTQQVVETVVVTAQINQHAGFSVDNIGRGNSLVIQLPRVKRTP